MEVFKGTVRLAGDTGTLEAVMLVADNRLKVKTSHSEIGDWELSELYSRIRPDGCHIVAEGEELIVSVDEPLRFAAAIGPNVSNPGDGSLLAVEGESGMAGRAVDALRRVGSAIPLEWKVAAGLAVLGAGLFALMPTALIGLVLFVALACLLVGGYAIMDSYVAVQLPDPFTPQLLFRGGLLALVVAILLALVA